MFAGNLEDVVGFFSVARVGVVVDVWVVLIDNDTVSFFFSLLHALLCFFESSFKNEHFELLFILAVGVIFDGVFCCDNGSLVVVTHIVAEVVVELGVFEFFKYEFVL